jgi:cell division protease FtsH
VKEKQKKESGQLILALIAVSLVLWVLFGQPNDATEKAMYSDFIASVKAGVVEEVNITGSLIEYKDLEGKEHYTYNPGDLGLMGDLIDSNVRVSTNPPEVRSSFLSSMLPYIFFLGLIWFLFRDKFSSITASRAKLITLEMQDTTLDDVAGSKEAKEEIEEVVDFLKNPEKYMKLGGKIPSGILLTGPPGTGKTLLAKAVAGSAEVPFYATSASEFVELFAGAGSARVRSMFAEARKNLPCIIFIDELDSIGKTRGSGGFGGNEEREQTLNQILVEMDGFEKSPGLIIMAATNRPEILDKALLRPGRFDRQVTVGLPDINSRAEILNVHAKKIKMADNVSINDIARGTPGLSGADLANLCNEAAIIAAKKSFKEVDMDCFDAAKDKVLMGPERRSMKMDEKERMLTAYHEAGHAIVGNSFELHDPVYKVSILPRGRALGITMFLPEKDKYSVSMDELKAQISTLYGGRLAEEIKYGRGSVTTGASNDIQRATEIARAMVVKYGMGGPELGPILYDVESNEYSPSREQYSEKTLGRIESEVLDIVKDAEHKARSILLKKKEILDNMANALMEYETISARQIDVLMQGEKI